MASSDLNAKNAELRASPAYAEWMRSQGIDPSRPIRLNDSQRKAFASFLRTQGVVLPKGVEIDPAGNLNENEGIGKQVKKWGPVAAGGALAAFGIPGVMPGLFTGSAATGAAASAAGAGTGVAATGGGAGGWLAPLLFSGIPAVANLFGAKMQANAADRGAEISAEAAKAGFQNLREMYEQDRKDFEPYLNAGGRMVTRAADLLEGYVPETYTPVAIRDREDAGGYMRPRPAAPTPAPAPTLTGRPTPQPSMADLNAPLTPSPEGVSTTRPMPRDQSGMTSQMVRVQAPDGEIRDLPMQQAAAAIRMGARRVAM